MIHLICYSAPNFDYVCKTSSDVIGQKNRENSDSKLWNWLWDAVRRIEKRFFYLKLEIQSLNFSTPADQMNHTFIFQFRLILQFNFFIDEFVINVFIFQFFQKNSNMHGKSVSTLKRNLNSYIWQRRDCFESYLENGNLGKVLFVKISKIYKFLLTCVSFLSTEDLESIQDLNMRLDIQSKYQLWLMSLVAH